MHRKITQLFRLPALVLAAALQIMPITRVALPAAQATADVLAIVFRWAAGMTAALGGVQAVSGASTVITSPLSTNIVQGQPFIMRLTTAPNQATYWIATGLPSGISLVGTNGHSFWELSGTPTVTGVFSVGLTAFESKGSSHNTSSTLAINISPGIVGTAPAITVQPTSITATQGLAASFSVTATGTAPLTYFWFQGAAVMTNGPNATFTIASAQPANAGTYSVIVSNSFGRITSSNVTLTVISPPAAPAITGQPANQSVTIGQNVTFTVTAIGSAPLSYFWGQGAMVLTNSANPSFTLFNVQTNQAGAYFVVVSNSLGTATSSNATLTVSSAATPPGIAVQPTNRFIYQGQNVSLSVTATGTGPLSYQWRRNGVNLADNTRLSGTHSNLFTITGALDSDSGRYGVVITNSAGSITSQVAVLTVTNTAILIVHISGNGTVSPDYNGQSLFVGSNYTLTANAGTGYVFEKWTGSIFSTAGSLTFVMQPGLALQANFVTSPYPQLTGIYNGIFYDTNDISQPGSGGVMIDEKNAGAFAGWLQMGVTKWPFKGQFDDTGHAVVPVKRGRMIPLTLNLQMDLFGGSDQITGMVTADDNSWMAELIANRAGFNAKTNPCPEAGMYTLVIPGTPGAAQSPAGDGYALVRITAAGQITLTASLADGTPASQTTSLSKSGNWAVYVPLYVGRGSLLGGLTFTHAPDRDIDGWLSWIRPVQPSVALYTVGFAVMSEPIGSQFTKPSAGSPVLNFASGMVVFSDGNLSAGFTNQIQVAANNKVTNLSANGLKLAINPGNGLFSGQVQDPATGKYHVFKGVLLQKSNQGGGYFLNQNQSGEVYIGAAPGGD